jgi:hypothetical protein
MGLFSFVNQLGMALTSANAKGPALKAAYETALRNYNGHPVNKFKYPGNVFNKIEKTGGILKTCPPVQTPQQLTASFPQK